MAEKQVFFTLMGGRVKMQRGHYNPTSDAVWLVALGADCNAHSVLDAGIGTGGVSLCLMANCPDVHITGIDISDEMLAECARNADLNNKEMELIHGDILTWRTSRTFDMVISNPPYFKGTPAGHNAHHNVDLAAWTARCVARVRPRGFFCTIVDASVVADVVSAMNVHCGDIYILPLFGSKGTAERVLLRGRVGTRGGTIIQCGMSMNTDAVLRDGLTIAESLSRLNIL